MPPIEASKYSKQIKLYKPFSKDKNKWIIVTVGLKQKEICYKIGYICFNVVKEINK